LVPVLASHDMVAAQELRVYTIADTLVVHIP